MALAAPGHVVIDMNLRSAATVLAIAALAVPSVLAENPTVSVPQVDADGVGAATTDPLAAAATALAEGAPAQATGIVDAVSEGCSPATPDEVLGCEVVVPTDNVAGAIAFASGGVSGVIAGTSGIQSLPTTVVFPIVLTKEAEAQAIVDAIAAVLGPAVPAGVGTIVASAQDNLCAVGPLAVPPAGAPSCGSDGLLADVEADATDVRDGALAVVAAIDGTATCLGFKAVVASLADASAIDCSAIPNGGAIVALVPDP